MRDHLCSGARSLNPASTPHTPSFFLFFFGCQLDKSSTVGRAAAAATGYPASYSLNDVIGRAKVLAARIRIKQDSAQRTFSRMAKLERFDSTAKHYHSTSVPAK